MTDRSAYLVGVGETEFSRDSGRSTQVLAIEAIMQAIQDAGVDRQQIDGIVPFFQGPSSEDVMGALGLAGVTFTAVPHVGGAGSVAAVRLAAMAIEAGLASCVIAFVARNGRSGVKVHDRVKDLTGQPIRQELEWPSGMNTPAQWYSLLARRHMIEYGTGRDALAAVALAMRRHANSNPHAQMYERALTATQYFDAPVIADPYHLFDCSLETDGASALLIGNRSIADATGLPLVRVEGSGEGHPVPADDIANRRDFFRIGLSTAAPQAFAMAGLTPGDVDVAMIYDCFTFEVIHQLEEAGFCPQGEGGAFVIEGNIERTGSLPVNPHGGLLSEGHMAGMNHVVEAVRQLRWSHEPSRQIRGAEVAAVTGWGDMGDGSMILLTRV